MSRTNLFFPHLFSKIIESVNNEYDDNYDKYRFGEIRENSKKTHVFKRIIKRILNRKGFYNSTLSLQGLSHSLTTSEWLFDFEFLYGNLATQHSRNLLIDVVAYRFLGFKKVKLPLNTPQYWKSINTIEKNENKDDFIDSAGMNFRLFYNDLRYLNYPIKLYLSTIGILTDFVVRQYYFSEFETKINVEEGDVVIDGGGCYADTALYFANETGANGMVHSFEFIPSNVNIWRKNVALNPHLAPNILLSENALWSKSNVNLYFLENGPGSKVAFEEFSDYDGIIKTTAIDDYVENKELDKIDFIKLDIEGAELDAIKGAVNTIRKYKPKLAIALYHSTKDFYEIPKYLNDLGIGYQFYLSHSTIHAEETMLFAKPN